MPGEYRYKARCLDRDHHHQADGTPYPSPPVQEARGLVGPVFTTLQALPTVRGLVVGSFQGASDDVHALAREVATRRATDEWRRMGARSFSDAYGIYLNDTRARWSGGLTAMTRRGIRRGVHWLAARLAPPARLCPPPYSTAQRAVRGVRPCLRTMRRCRSATVWACCTPGRLS